MILCKVALEVSLSVSQVAVIKFLYSTISSEGMLSSDLAKTRKLKLFFCSDCDKRFTTKFSRNRHYENQHRMENETSSSSMTDDNSCNDSSSHDEDGNSMSDEDRDLESIDDISMSGEDRDSGKSGDDSSISEEGGDSKNSGDDNSISEEDEDSENSGDDNSISEEDGDSENSADDNYNSMSGEDSGRSEDDDSVIDEKDELYPYEDLVYEALRSHGEEYYKLMSQAENDDEEVDMFRDKISRTLRKIIANYMIDIENKKSDQLFKAIKRKSKEYEDDGFSTDEAILAAVDYWKHMIKKLIPF